LQQISQDPVGWCIKHEKLSTFKKWVKIAENWVTPKNNNEDSYKLTNSIDNRENVSDYVWSFTDKYMVNYKIKPLTDCITKADCFSFAVFSAMGQCQVSEEFVRSVWSVMHQSSFFTTKLEDYYRSLVFNGHIGTIEWLAWSPISSENIRQMLLEDNTAAKIRYLLERHMISQERKRYILWEPLILSKNYEKISELDTKGVFIPWDYVRLLLGKGTLANPV